MGFYFLPAARVRFGIAVADRCLLHGLADLFASANPGCTLKIQEILRERGQTFRAAHPIEILGASISGTRL